jgi:small subunit ribosomal protein S4
MKIGPRYKICKRLGSNIFEKCQTRSFAISKERSGASKKKGRRSVSDFSRQLIEKQKLRLTYGLSERQFAGYVEKSLESGANPQAVLFGLLESRLDSVAYRMGIVSTRRAARQLVSHGHLTVNGRKVTVPSYQASAGDSVAIREGSRDSGLFAGLSERLKEYRFPTWVQFDAEKKEGSLDSLPVMKDQDTPADIGAVFEYYTR